MGLAAHEAEHLDARKQMMQSWSDFIDFLCAGANVVPMKRKA
jgi:hypothetical protein